MLMNIKKITLVLSLAFSLINLKVSAEEFKYDSLYAGKINVMGAQMELPDLGRWHYFAFDEKNGVVFKGTSAFELENINAGKVGTEIINAEWKARTDWDFAFHAFDLRTNSGLAGNGAAGAVFIADAASQTPLQEIYDALTEAPEKNYAADAPTNGQFYLSLTSGMPPLRATSLSVSSVTRKAAEGTIGATADFSTLAMQGAAVDNPMIIVLKTTSGKYVKVYLKQFSENGKPGILKFDYDFIPLKGNTGITSKPRNLSVYTHPISGELHINLENKSDIMIYNITGALVKEIKNQSGQITLPAMTWKKGIYIVKIASGKESFVQRIIVK